MTDTQRKQLNEQRLEKIDPSIRPKVAAVIADMEGHGLEPIIASNVFREPAEQLRLYKSGRSQVRWGFHCAKTKDGKPGSLAADIVDAKLGWNAPGKFWLMLGSSAMAHGLGWGGLWGLPDTLRKGILKIIEDKDWNRPVKFGWDVSHIETTAVTVAQAKAGKR